MLQTFLLEERLKRKWALKENLGTRGAPQGHLKITWRLQRHSKDTRALAWHLDTQALRHSSTYLADSKIKLGEFQTDQKYIAE